MGSNSRGIISKASAQKLWTRDDERLFSQAEAKINKAIEEHGGPGERLLVDLDGLDLPKRVKDRINTLCREGGWKTSWSSGGQLGAGPFLDLT